MKRKRIIAALLTGTMLCSSIPMNIQASDLDAVFDDGGAAAEGNTPDTEGNISATEDEINTDGTDVNNSNMDDISDENMETPDVFTDENGFGDGTDEEFTDSVDAESEEALSAEAADAVYDAVWNGHYYKVYDSPMKWNDAKKYCEKQGGHLVTITSKEEHEEVSSLISHGSKNFYWLGAERTQNVFDRWITGETIKYTNYDRTNNEPNNFTGSENALVIYRIRNPKGGIDGQYKWNDLQKDGDCNGESFFGYQNSGFVCEWDDGKKEETTKDNSAIHKKVQNLLINSNYSSYPLLEYDDPVNLAVGFSETPGGFFQAFVKTYGDINTKNNLWEQEYEEVLITLLADDTLTKKLIEGWDKDLSDLTTEFLEKATKEAISDFSSSTGNAINISLGIFTDAVRNQIKQDIGNILILSELAANTDDKNLQKACQVCMSHSLNGTFRAIGDILIDAAVGCGVSTLVAKEVVQNQILATSLKKGVLQSIAKKFALGTAASWVTGVISVKDVLSFATGINKRVDSYLKTVALNFVYIAAADAYGKNVTLIKSGKTDAALNVYVLFQFILNVKQEAYDTMQEMFVPATWTLIVDSDKYLKSNINSIKNITIENYAKKSLGSLKPAVINDSISLNINSKKDFPCTGISHLSNVKYSSDNSKIAKVNSSGSIQAKTTGTTYIRCKVRQYGDTYNLVCKVTVKNGTTSNKKDPTAAYRSLIKKYEKKYGAAKLNKQNQFWTGLCYAKLLDFNNDGINELILTYQTERYNKDKVQYHVELWKYDGKSAKRVTSRISWSGNNMPYFGGLGICKYNGKYLLELTGNACGDNYYYGTKKDGSVGLVHKFIWKGDAMEGDWYMDGKKVSGNMYGTYYKKYHANATWYSFAQSSNNSLIRKELSNTKKKLGM